MALNFFCVTFSVVLESNGSFEIVENRLFSYTIHSDHSSQLPLPPFFPGTPAPPLYPRSSPGFPLQKRVGPQDMTAKYDKTRKNKTK